MNEKPNPISVLLVDDETDFLQLTARALERRGFDVSTAASGKEAIAQNRSVEFDVAVLDVRMPDADGHELYYRLKVDRPDLEVVMLTGHGEVHKAFELSKHGVVDYLTKPCDIDQLASAIRQAGANRLRDRISVEFTSDVGQPGDEAVHALVVDDDAEFLKFARRGLEKMGFRVETAGSGSAGMDVIRTKPIDVALVDIEMEGIDGLAVLYQTKIEKPIVEVVLLTGYASVRSAVRGLQQGAFDYLTKPQPIGEIARVIRAAAAKKRNAERTEIAETIQELVRRNPT